MTEIIIDFSNYKLYSRGTKSGGAVVKSSGSGGGSVISSSSGGSVQTTSGYSNPGFYLYSSTRLPLVDPTFDNHIHALEVTDELNHAHSISIPSHQHSVTVPAHSHSVDIPAHTHDIEYGIFTLDRLPTAVTIKVDGNTVPYTGVEGDGIDLVPYLDRDENGNIIRGWHRVEILPNDLGRINAQVTTQFFIQSRGKYTL